MNFQIKLTAYEGMLTNATYRCVPQIDLRIKKTAYEDLQAKLVRWQWLSWAQRIIVFLLIVRTSAANWTRKTWDVQIFAARIAGGIYRKLRQPSLEQGIAAPWRRSPRKECLSLFTFDHFASDGATGRHTDQHVAEEFQALLSQKCSCSHTPTICSITST